MNNVFIVGNVSQGRLTTFVVVSNNRVFGYSKSLVQSDNLVVPSTITEKEVKADE